MWTAGTSPKRFVDSLPDNLRGPFYRAVVGAPVVARAMVDSFDPFRKDTTREARFVFTGTPDDILPVQLSPIICSDMLVTDVAYSIELLASSPENYWDPVRLEAFTKAPGIDIQVENYAQMLGKIYADWIPVQNWARPTVLPLGNNGWPSVCWLLRYCDDLRVRARSTRTLTVTTTGMVMRMTFSGMIFRRQLQGYDPDQALSWLTENGFADLAA